MRYFGNVTLRARLTDASGSQLKVSLDGGGFARCNSNGRELYYLSPSGALMAVQANINEPVFSHRPAQGLFRTRIAATEMADLAPPYDVSKDGRFLMRVPGDEQLRPITVLSNWSSHEEIKPTTQLSADPLAEPFPQRIRDGRSCMRVPSGRGRRGNRHCSISLPAERGNYKQDVRTYPLEFSPFRLLASEVVDAFINPHAS
jgi:hypothetical protein